MFGGSGARSGTLIDGSQWGDCCRGEWSRQIVPVDMELFEWDKRYINPLYGQCRPFVDFPVLLSLYRQGRLKLDEMVTRTYPLSGLAEAFEHMKQGINAKGVLIPNGSD